MNKEDLKVIECDRIVGRHGDETEINKEAIICDLLHGMGIINSGDFNKIIILTDEEIDHSESINKMLDVFISQITGGTYIHIEPPLKNKDDDKKATVLQLKRY